MVAVRLRAGADRRRRDAHLPEQLAPRHRVHPRPLRVGRRALCGCAPGGTRRRARELVARPPAPADGGRSGRARGRGRALPRGAPDGARRGDRCRRRGRSLHAPVHLGHDGPAEGLHGAASQLLRDGVGDRPSAELRARRRPDAAVPPARPQLRAADAPHRPVRRLHDRLPARSAADRGRAADRASDGTAERAPRLREDPHRRRRGPRRDDGREAPVGRLVAPDRARGRQAAGGGPARRRRAEAEGRPRRPARLREDPRSARRPPADADLGRRAARPGDRRVLRRGRHQDLRGLRAQRVHDGRDDEHADALAVRDRRAGPAGLRAQNRRGR